MRRPAVWTRAGSSVAGGRRPPLLVGRKGALDDGALGAGGGAGGILAPAFAPASAPGRFLVLLDGDLAGEPAPWAVPVPRAPGVPLCRRAPRPVSSGAVRPGRARASIMGDEHRGVPVGPAPRQRPGDAAVDHRVDPRARPHAMAGPLNEPVPTTSASPLRGRTRWSRAGGRGRRTSPRPRPSRGRRAHRPGPSGPGGRRPARRPAPRRGGVPTPSAPAHSTRADHATPPPNCW